MEGFESDNRPDSEDTRSEYFFDKTEYHTIMAEALRTTSGVEMEGVLAKSDPEEIQEEKENNRTFYLLALIYCLLVLAAGFIAYSLTQT